MPEALVSANEIAKNCGGGITGRAVLRWAKAGRIPFVKINARVIRFDPEQVRKRLLSK